MTAISPASLRKALGLEEAAMRILRD